MNPCQSMQRNGLSSWQNKQTNNPRNVSSEFYVNQNTSYERDAIYSEAREILNQWATRSMIHDSNEFSECEDNDAIVLRPNRKEIKLEWDHLLDTEHKVFNQPCHSDLNTYIMTELRNSRFVRKHLKNISPRVQQKPKPLKNTLENILARQEEARARRELRRHESELRANEVRLKKQAIQEAFMEFQKADRQMRLQQKMEEELVQQEMVKVRKELEYEREIRSRKQIQKHQSSPNNKSAQLNSSIQRDISIVPPLILSSNSCSAASSVENLKTLDSISISTNQITIEERNLMAKTFEAWSKHVRKIKITCAALTTRHDYRLKRLYFRRWLNLIRQSKIESEIRLAKQMALELEKKVTAAKIFHETFMIRKAFRGWKIAIHLCRNEQQIREREELRRLKELKFLDSLDKCCDSQTNQNQSEENRGCLIDAPISVRDLNQVDRKIESEMHRNTPQSSCRSNTKLNEASLEISNPCRPKSSLANHPINSETKKLPRQAYATIDRPRIADTVLQQRQRIADQNRIIEELRSANRYVELQLQARVQSPVDSKVKQKGKLTCRMYDASKEDSISKEYPISSRSLPEYPSNLIEESNQNEEQERNENDRHFEDENGMTEVWASPVNVRPASSVPKNAFVRRMEERAAERARVRALQEEKKRMLEKRKQEEKARQLEEEARQIKERKRSIIEAQREKKRQEEERRRLEEARLLRAQEINRKIAEHRRIQCLRFYGLVPWMKYISDQKSLAQQATIHYERMSISLVFYTWFHHCREIQRQVNAFVENFYNRCLIKRVFQQFLQVCVERRQRELEAVQWHENQLKLRTFSAWSNYLTELYAQECDNTDIALTHYHRQLLNKTLQSWKTFPALQRVERLREQRRERFRERLKDLVPDFSPPKQYSPE